jgi:bifunctional non-homologous end joining protein LigD
MKAVTGPLPTPDEEPSWSFEIKWDGMRVVSCTDGTDVRLWSANAIDVTHRFPELAGLGDAMRGRPAVLDGEIVVFDETGTPSFSLLQRRMHVTDTGEARRRSTTVPVHYAVFDVVHFDGHDLTSLGLDQRVDVLDEVFRDGVAWRQVERHRDGRVLFHAVVDARLEGIMAKRRDAPYLPGRRSPAWRKVKSRLHAEFVVGGWLPGMGAREGRPGALLVGYHDGPHLRFAGRVGSGLSDAELDTIAPLLVDLARSTDPFEPPIRRADAPGARFVEPRLVVEVAYAEWTPDGRLRHPSYLGRRFDKDPRDVTRP